jgi:predicted nucleic-acid-binding protein
MSDVGIQAGLDTSVLLRLLVGRPADQYASAVSFMETVESSGRRVLVSNLVVAEAYFACQHHYGLSKGEVLAGMRSLLSLPTFVVHPAALGLLGREGIGSAKPGFLDRLIHAEYEECGVPLATFEKACRKLSGVRVLGTSRPGAQG